ncbi:hypothetical protein AB0I39_33275 [Kitasatospora purpeofusca]|uniref:hypothetical protein n=1 Tax=Kitasatospora purpeofusca TaxID=67352 RepID=UPI0033DB8961
MLAFRFRKDPPAIAVPKVKTLASRDRTMVQDTYESLDKVLGRLDENVAFTNDRAHTFLAHRLGVLLRPSAAWAVERYMLFVHDARSSKEDIVKQFDQQVSERTELTIVKIAELRDFVARVYDAAAETATGRTDKASHARAAAGPGPSIRDGRSGRSA